MKLVTMHDDVYARLRSVKEKDGGTYGDVIGNLLTLYCCTTEGYAAMPGHSDK
jgi:hypothetical protein